MGRHHFWKLALLPVCVCVCVRVAVIGLVCADGKWLRFRLIITPNAQPSNGTSQAQTAPNAHESTEVL